MTGVLNLWFVPRFPKRLCKRCQENVSSTVSQCPQSASSPGIKAEASVVPSWLQYTSGLSKQTLGNSRIGCKYLFLLV